MRKSFVLLFLSLICITVNAQSIEKIYYFEEPEIVTADGYSRIIFEGSRQYGESGCPSLPYHTVSLLLPMGCEAESVEIQLLDFKDIEGSHILYPYQEAIPYSHKDKFKFVKNDDIYATKGVYPSRSHNDVTTHYLNGYSFAFVNFTPVQYLPSEGKVKYAQKVKVTVTTDTEREDHSSMLWSTPQIMQSVNNLAHNPEMMSSYKTRERSIAGYDILVVTGKDYIDGFAEYVNHYNSIGYRTEIVAVEDIYSNMLGQDEQSKIRNYIIQEYQNNGITMVMLGGDVEIIPFRGLYCSVSEEYTDYGIPSDLYYCGLDGTWNSNDNDKWGEWFEADMLPEIGVARLPFADAEEQENMIHKTLSYQRNPVVGEFRDITLGSEIMDDTPTYGGDYLELIIGRHDDNGYTTIGIPEDYNFTRVYAEHDTWSAENLTAAINRGTQYIHHAGHANSNFVAGWYLEDITNGNFSDVNGIDHNYTFFHSHGCICGAFDEDCILERMVKIDNFCVAVSGNSRYGWYCPGWNEGPAGHLHRELVDAQYNDKLNNLAMSLRESRLQTAPTIGNSPADMWNLYDLNVLGDGAAPIWLDEPIDVDVDCEKFIMIGSDKLELTVTDMEGNAMTGFRCSYHSQDDELIGFALTDENGKAEIIFESPLHEIGLAKLIVTGMNAYPNTKEVIVYDTDKPYVIMEDYYINDTDGQLDYSENHVLDMSFRNISNKKSNFINVTLSCDKPEYVNITSAILEIENIDADTTIDMENAFAFTVCDSVPNNTVVRFFVTCTDGTETWESKFDMNIYAPEFEIVKPAGLELNPVDIATIEFTIINKGGSDANNIVFPIFPPEEISVSQDKFFIPGLTAGEETNIEMTLTVSENAEYGYAYVMPMAVYSGRYITRDSYAVVIGSVTEDFETGDFSKFDWELAGDSNWEIVSDNAYEGQYCVKSGGVENNSSTTLQLTLDVKTESTISFYKKVSSENNYDELIFYIDDKTQDKWSGEVDWSMETYTLGEGLHILKWSYNKDVSYEDGQDCAWLDNIILPPTSFVVDVETFEEKNIEVYPNPARDYIKLSALSRQPSVVKIYNALGMLIDEIQRNSNEMEINVSDYKSGIYFINIQAETTSFVTKFVKD